MSKPEILESTQKQIKRNTKQNTLIIQLTVNAGWTAFGGSKFSTYIKHPKSN